MVDPPLDIGDAPAGIALIPAAVEFLSSGRAHSILQAENALRMLAQRSNSAGRAEAKPNGEVRRRAMVSPPANLKASHWSYR
jgi:hypothetical protein